MPEGRCFDSEDSAGSPLPLDWHQQQLALDFHARSGSIRVSGNLPVELGPCQFELNPFPEPTELSHESVLLASVRLFRLAHQSRQATPGD